MQTKTESVDHLVSSCPILTPIEYKERHYKLGYYTHCKICKYYGIVDCEKCYQHQPEPIMNQMFT